MNHSFLWSMNDDQNLIRQELKWDYKSVHTKCIKNIPPRIWRWDEANIFVAENPLNINIDICPGYEGSDQIHFAQFLWKINIYRF